VRESFARFAAKFARAKGGMANFVRFEAVRDGRETGGTGNSLRFEAGTDGTAKGGVNPAPLAG